MSDWKKLAEQYCQTGTSRYYFASGLRVDLSTDPWIVLQESGASRLATESEISTIQNQLQSLPILKPLNNRRDVYDSFTANEQSAIRSAAPQFVERLLMADEPIALETLLPYLRDLVTAGLLTQVRFQALTGLEN